MDIVILHGWGHSRKMWMGFCSMFKKQNVICPDLPGFGERKLISDKWKVSDYADWLEKYLNNQNLEDIVLIGHSFGGKIAIEYASRHQTKIKKIILISAPVLRRPSLPTKIKIIINKIFKLTHSSLKATIKNSEYEEAKRTGLGKVFTNSVVYDATSILPKIKVPTLIVWGDKDKDAPVEIAAEMHRMIKNSKIEILSGLAHNIYLENPVILYGLINNFIDEQI